MENIQVYLMAFWMCSSLFSMAGNNSVMENVDVVLSFNAEDNKDEFQFRLVISNSSETEVLSVRKPELSLGEVSFCLRSLAAVNQSKLDDSYGRLVREGPIRPMIYEGFDVSPRSHFTLTYKCERAEDGGLLLDGKYLLKPSSLTHELCAQVRLSVSNFGDKSCDVSVVQSNWIPVENIFKKFPIVFVEEKGQKGLKNNSGKSVVPKLPDL